MKDGQCGRQVSNTQRVWWSEQARASRQVQPGVLALGPLACTDVSRGLQIGMQHPTFLTLATAMP